MQVDTPQEAPPHTKDPSGLKSSSFHTCADVPQAPGGLLQNKGMQENTTC